MDNTQKVIEGIRAYILSHPKEKPEVVATLEDMADKLESKEMSIIQTSAYIKNLKETWNIAIFEIFSEIYREAKKK